MSLGTNPLARSQYNCHLCGLTSFSIFAKRDDGKVFLCSQKCFDDFRLTRESPQKSHKWYVRFTITKETVEEFCQNDKK